MCRQWICGSTTPPGRPVQSLRTEREDTFLHLSFDFPLIDWGRRYRGVQTARMQKAQAFHDLARKRTEYSNKWLEAEQKASLAQTELKLSQTRYDTAEMKYKEAKISFGGRHNRIPPIFMKWDRKCWKPALILSRPNWNTNWPNWTGCMLPICFRSVSWDCQPRSNM